MKMRLIAITEDGALAEPVPALEGVAADIPQSTTAMYGRKGYVPPWLAYMALEGGQVVGTCAFVGPPHNGEVEIAYFTFPDFENRGVATRMVSSMLEIIAAQAAAEAVQPFAHTLPEENSSAAVLRKSGFALAGEVMHPEDGKVWRWRGVSA